MMLSPEGFLHLSLKGMVVVKILAQDHYDEARYHEANIQTKDYRKFCGG